MRVRRFLHAKVDVSDLACSEHFYRELLGLTEIARFELEKGWIVQYSPAPGTPGVELWYERDRPSVTADASFHLAFLVDDVRALVGELRAAGVPVAREPFDVPGESIAFVLDPDGHSVELNQPLDAGGAERPAAIAIYCGAEAGSSDMRRAAADAGHAAAQAGVTVVYGGASIGLMGVLADAALGAGGRVVGVIPQSLVDQEKAHSGLTELHVVATMHERKQRMSELSDAFLVLPGGVGTLDEFVEALTWRGLGLHAKPIVLCDVGGYFAPLLEFFAQAVDARLLQASTRACFTVAADPGAAVAALIAGLQASGHDAA